MRKSSYPDFFKKLALLAGTAALLSGCDSAILDPKGPIGVEQRNLIVIAVLLMLIVVIPAIVMTVLFAWKYRASNKDATYSPNWSHSNKIEAVVWGIPCVIILVLATITWKTSHSLDPFKALEGYDEEPLTIEVVALDWKWLFIYPEQQIATVNEVAFPANVPIEFQVTSDTVMNSFFIPHLGSQIYAMAGMQTEVNLLASEPGDYPGISAQYSGSGFSGMKFNARALDSREQFQAWVNQVQQSPKQLNQSAYDKLAKPSEDAPVEYYSTVIPNLFTSIIHKYMGGAMQAGSGHEGMQHHGAEE
ncbi:ubiquinol oxidase subunit II [Larsenimonas rhizosphaerae]|uniref:Ubiquinol oxidase subunit 2 n=1 Tax=Larsenimonas rhizosphaerae TaxID=2944682 RepID=A0AA42CVN8_9GAMM|nr:ubiquinol oxidase subunit II [Larsenimonas rhizosphaerae]MCM2132120.1 ubiquinol oxidase subunit II [Larsenimonas rhizosphaerae]MCX2525574.1 ubiquinol oxidase subunit II [Larsenimonas rhizosphaerae]